jgi:membrane associated rhomboid family serine protease/Tfp pilus assembly protein PilF
LQRPPAIREAAKYPATSLVCLAAIGVTLAYWNQWDIAPLVMNGSGVGREPWRLVTSCLPHLSLPHLFFNVYWVWVFGTYVERTFGSLRMLGVVVLLAAASSAAEWAFFEGGVGLSGVGYGLFGMLWALRRRPGFEHVIDQRTVGLFVVWFFICIVTTVMGVMKIGNVAHGAGAGVGYLLGMCVAAEKPRRQTLTASLIAVAVVIWALASVGRPWVNMEQFSSNSLVQRGYDALQVKKNQEAADLLNRAVKLNPKNARAWFMLGVARQGLNDYAGALDACLMAAQIDPSPTHKEAVAAAAGDFARTQIRDGRLEAARATLKQAIDIAPQNSNLWMWSGAERLKAGDRDGAIAALERSVEFDPKNTDAQKLLDYARAQQPP